MNDNSINKAMLIQTEKDSRNENVYGIMKDLMLPLITLLQMNI
ncbi:MAG: hypothetical protein PHW52_03555 [Candidatus Pacebacteria bacterium]|nr:hypothetical protein [Candidatus Paceibacterota bacterium]